jgi:hypothetical protein
MNHTDILLCNYDRKVLEMLTGKLLGDGNIIIQKIENRGCVLDIPSKIVIGVFIVIKNSLNFL